jgi:hypothetical protein
MMDENLPIVICIHVEYWIIFQFLFFLKYFWLMNFFKRLITETEIFCFCYNLSAFPNKIKICNPIDYPQFEQHLFEVWLLM